MLLDNIEWHTQHHNFKKLKAKSKYDKLLKKVLIEHELKLNQINYIFCDKDYILQINKEHLQHNYYTDIITFDYTEQEIVNAEIYISIDTVKENAESYNTTFTEELLRVMIHGVLHICGHKDKTKKEQKLMRAKEDYYTEIFNCST